jgi:hypothetical protein
VGRVRPALAAHRSLLSRPQTRATTKRLIRNLTGSRPAARAPRRPGRERYPRAPCLQARRKRCSVDRHDNTAGRRAKEPRRRRQRSGGRGRSRTHGAGRAAAGSAPGEHRLRSGFAGPDKPRSSPISRLARCPLVLGYCDARSADPHADRTSRRALVDRLGDELLLLDRRRGDGAWSVRLDNDAERGREGGG